MKRIYLLSVAFLFAASWATQVSAKKVYTELTTPEEAALKITQCCTFKGVDYSKSLSHLRSRVLKKKELGRLRYHCGFYKPENLVWNTMEDEPIVSPDGKMYMVCRAINLDRKFFRMLFKSNDHKMVVVDEPYGVTGDRLNGMSWGSNNIIYFESEKGVFSMTPEENTQLKFYIGSTGIPYYHAKTNSLFLNKYGSMRNYDIKEQKYTSTPEFESGKCPTVFGDYMYYVRNGAMASEIWRRNLITQKEEKVLSDPKHGFSNPSISPDGKWLVCEGSSYSPLAKRHNIDIFIARIDGTGLKQITNHPADDLAPAWLNDGRVIFFSTRGQKYDKTYGVNHALFCMDISTTLK